MRRRLQGQGLGRSREKVCGNDDLCASRYCNVGIEHSGARALARAASSDRLDDELFEYGKNLSSIPWRVVYEHWARMWAGEYRVFGPIKLRRSLLGLAPDEHDCTELWK